jgi:hypothetical protein
MAIEIDVVPNFAQSEVAGVLSGSVIIRFDGPVETMLVHVLFKDRADQTANEAAAISAAKHLAFRLTQHRDA